MNSENKDLHVVTEESEAQNADKVLLKPPK